MEVKKITIKIPSKLRDTENRLVVATNRGCRVGEMDEGSQKVQTSSIKQVMELSVQCGIIAITTVLHTRKWLRVDLKSFHVIIGRSMVMNVNWVYCGV